jgi:hypothetical protein
MAMMKHQGTFLPATYNPSTRANMDGMLHLGSCSQYTYDCVFRKEDPSIIVKWCRRNFGERGNGWDFYLNQGRVIIEIRNDKYKVMYEMWHV